jgi:hypothetical protein
MRDIITDEITQRNGKYSQLIHSIFTGRSTSVLFCGIVGPVAQKRRAGQGPKDAFSIR